jgi:hypothetical protein
MPKCKTGQQDNGRLGPCTAAEVLAAYAHSLLILQDLMANLLRRRLTRARIILGTLSRWHALQVTWTRLTSAQAQSPVTFLLY